MKRQEREPDGSHYAPLTNRYPRLEIVREQVAWAFARRGWSTKDSHRFNELFGIGQLKLTEILAENPEPSNALLRQALKRAFMEDRPQLAVPRRTRSRWGREGKKFEEFKQHSLDAVFDSNGVSTKSLAAHPHWADTESQWTAEQCKDHEVFETYDLLYSLSWDDVDRAILEARWDGGRYLPTNGDAPNQMLHVEDVAALCGLRPQEVQRRLNDLEARYYKRTHRTPPTGRMPKGNRRLAARRAAA